MNTLAWIVCAVIVIFFLWGDDILHFIVTIIREMKK